VHHNWTLSIASARCQRARNTHHRYGRQPLPLLVTCCDFPSALRDIMSYLVTPLCAQPCYLLHDTPRHHKLIRSTWLVDRRTIRPYYGPSPGSITEPACHRPNIMLNLTSSHRHLLGLPAEFAPHTEIPHEQLELAAPSQKPWQSGAEQSSPHPICHTRCNGCILYTFVLPYPILDQCFIFFKKEK
jgi:hypothetical protein